MISASEAGDSAGVLGCSDLRVIFAGSAIGCSKLPSYVGSQMVHRRRHATASPAWP